MNYTAPIPLINGKYSTESMDMMCHKINCHCTRSDLKRAPVKIGLLMLDVSMSTRVVRILRSTEAGDDEICTSG